MFNAMSVLFVLLAFAPWKIEVERRGENVTIVPHYLIGLICQLLGEQLRARFPLPLVGAGKKVQVVDPATVQVTLKEQVAG